jgi:hypothetical protein
MLHFFWVLLPLLAAGSAWQPQIFQHSCVSSKWCICSYAGKQGHRGQRGSGFLPKDASAFKLLICIKHLYFSGSIRSLYLRPCIPLLSTAFRVNQSQCLTKCKFLFCRLKRYHNANAEVI